MLSALDLWVLAIYLATIAWVGLQASRRQSRDGESFFLASHSVPWWAAGVSILATETSALTFIGAPTQAVRGDWTYLQLTFGSAIGRIAVAVLLIGTYYRLRVYTVYELLAHRFGPRSHNMAVLLFFAGRLMASGVRLYGGAIALVVVAGFDFPVAIVLIASVAVFYTLLGGLRSVIWTDFLQATLLVGGGLVALVLLVDQAGSDPCRNPESAARRWPRRQLQAAHLRSVAGAPDRLYALGRSHRQRAPHDVDPWHGPGHDPEGSVLPRRLGRATQPLPQRRPHSAGVDPLPRHRLDAVAEPRRR